MINTIIGTGIGYMIFNPNGRKLANKIGNGFIDLSKDMMNEINKEIKKESEVKIDNAQNKNVYGEDNK